MNTERDNVKAALIEVTGGSRRNKTARLRDYYDWVMEAKAAGASNKVLVNALAKNGLIFDIDTFKHALHRIKKERVIDALIIKSADEVARPASPVRTVQQDNVTTLPQPKSADALERPPGISNSAWSEMRVKAAKDERKK
jgi:hypothetical protein